MKGRLYSGAAAALVALAAVVPLRALLERDRFDHLQHKALFPTCESCHAGVVTAESAGDPSIWPSAESCAACHDGTIEKRVDWQPPEPPRTNLAFTHPMHRAEEREEADSTLRCWSCHAAQAGREDRMAVELAVVDNCLDCHKVRGPHLAAPDSACATCHVPLAQAVRLTAADIADFPEPPSHERPDFLEEGHGRLAEAGPGAVAASCATCHAQNFCAECHVNAPEIAAIQALAPDPRIAAGAASLRVPPSHREPDFLSDHGRETDDGIGRCATCHTQESCLVCHVGTPGVARTLAVASADRGRGAVTERRRPPSHGADFSEVHGPAASARPQSCAACHARPECLDCHRPDPGAASPGYHRVGFLVTHPVQAYQRESSCSDCHNPGQFCSSCHANVGLTAIDLPLDAGYHDAKRSFIAGHGQAARQSLESCVSCHTETDCMSCHATSVLGGRNFSPHGPGFDAERLARRNPQMCSACHGSAIPGRD
ncbi:MAG TPA: cytochrome c3 family protein [Gemmatimonadales bacterium]